MPYLADRVKDLAASPPGTGAVTLAGTPPTGYRTFASGLGGACTTGYCLDDGAGNWEVGKGYFNGTTGLTRDVIRASSNSNALVNFSGGTISVFITASAELLDNANTGQISAVARGLAMP